MRYFIGRTISAKNFKRAEDTYLLLFRLSSEMMRDKFLTISICPLPDPLFWECLLPWGFILHFSNCKGLPFGMKMEGKRGWKVGIPIE
jgi:hypothetical protein